MKLSDFNVEINPGSNDPAVFFITIEYDDERGTEYWFFCYDTHSHTVLENTPREGWHEIMDGCHDSVVRVARVLTFLVMKRRQAGTLNPRRRARH